MHQNMSSLTLTENKRVKGRPQKKKKRIFFFFFKRRRSQLIEKSMDKTSAFSRHRSSCPEVRSVVLCGCAGGLAFGSRLASSLREGCSEPYTQNNLHRDLKARALILWYHYFQVLEKNKKKKEKLPRKCCRLPIYPQLNFKRVLQAYKVA